MGADDKMPAGVEPTSTTEHLSSISAFTEVDGQPVIIPMHGRQDKNMDSVRLLGWILLSKLSSAVLKTMMHDSRD